VGEFQKKRKDRALPCTTPGSGIGIAAKQKGGFQSGPAFEATRGMTAYPPPADGPLGSVVGGLDIQLALIQVFIEAKELTPLILL
jgi:hypothetical protein